MGRRRPKDNSSNLIAEFYKSKEGWSWEVRSSERKLKRYFSSGLKSLSDAIDDFTKVVSG